MRVFAYCRASTSKQVASPATQEEIVRDYCKRHGLAIDGVFVDAATSGKKHIFERPAGKKMLETLQRGDRVIVARLDRLSRSVIDFAIVLNAWDKMGVVLTLCDMPAGSDTLDPNNPMSRLLVHMLISFAEYERSLISSRTKEGLDAIRARGGKSNHNSPPGWKWEGKKKDAYLLPDWEYRKHMAVALSMWEQGHTRDEIRQYFAYTWRVKQVDRGYTHAFGHDIDLNEWNDRAIMRLIENAVIFRDSCPELPLDKWGEENEEEFKACLQAGDPEEYARFMGTYRPKKVWTPGRRRARLEWKKKHGKESEQRRQERIRAAKVASQTETADG